MTPRPIRRAALLAGTIMASVTAVVGLAPNVASADDPVIVFYTQCDEMSPTATVKVKRINDDKTGAVTIGDTGITHCGDLTRDPLPERFHTGFAVAGEYGYYAWRTTNGTGAGIGRIRLDGSAAAETNFITIATEHQGVQMSPRSVGGNLFFYADSGQRIPGNIFSGQGNPRIMKANVTDKTVSVAYQPAPIDPAFPISRMSFGVGKDALYYSTDDTLSAGLERVTLSGTRTGTVFSFTTADNTMQFLNGSGANLVAESDDTLFLYAQKNSGPRELGISTAGTASPNTSFVSGGAAPLVAQDQAPQFQVMGGSFLYYKNGTGKQISRTTKTGTVQDNYFPSIVKDGWIHHISPALASTVTVTTTTTTSSTTTSSSTTSSTTTTVAAATSTTAAATTTSVATATSVATTTTTARAVTTTTVAAPTLPKKGGLPAARLASVAKVTVPKGARVGVSIAPASRKICAVRDGKLVSLKPGDCRVTVTVTPKQGKSTRTSATLKSS